VIGYVCVLTFNYPLAQGVITSHVYTRTL